MSKFSYVDKYGNIKFFEAPDSETALATTPSDANPRSGVRLYPTEPTPTTTPKAQTPEEYLKAGGALTNGQIPTQKAWSPEEVNNKLISGDTTNLSDEEYWSGENTGFSDEISYYDEETGEWKTRPMTPEEKITQQNAMSEERGIQEYEAKLPFYTGGGGGDPLAAQKAALKLKQAGTQNSYTSYAFNRDIIAGSKRAYDNLNAKLTDITSETWNSSGTKEDRKKGLLEVTANDIAKLFTSEQDFRSAYTFNPDFKLTIDNLTKAGVTQESIMGRITKPATYQDMPAEQSVSDYLGNNLSQDATQEQIEAYNALIPESKLSQDQVAYLAKIAQDKRNAYFGTSEKMGIIDEKIINAEEAKKTAEKKMQLADQDAKAQAQYVIDKNKADVDIELGKIEQNRLKAKNYMTGALAKLGALNTTGTAPLALATLDEKYESSASELRSKLTFANRKIEMDLTKEVNDIDIKGEESINEIANDLTKDKETIMKEILKIEADTNKEIYRINLAYAKDFRTLTDKYTAISKAEAEKFAKEFARIATNKAKAGAKALKDAPKEDSSVMEGQYSATNKGILLPDGTYEKYYLSPSVAQEVADANIVGKDTIVFFKSTESAFRDWFVKNNEKTDVYLNTLKASYDTWKEETAKKPTSTTATKKPSEETWGDN